MTKYAHNYSRITAALLALCAACGRGRPAPTMGSKFVRMQDPAELDTENGLIAVSLSDACLSFSLASAPTPTATTTSTTTTSTDPITGVTTTTTSTTDPATGVTTTTTTTNPTLTATDPTLVDPNACGDL